MAFLYRKDEKQREQSQKKKEKGGDVFAEKKAYLLNLVFYINVSGCRYEYIKK